MLSCDVVHGPRDVFMHSTMTLRNYHFDSVCVCLTKVNFTTSLSIVFFLQDELFQVEAGNHQTETTVIFFFSTSFQQQLTCKIYSLRNQTMITRRPDN